MATEAQTIQDEKTGRSILQLTNNSQRSVHGYYDLPPWSAVHGRIAFSRMEAPHSKTGDICVIAQLCVLDV